MLAPAPSPKQTTSPILTRSMQTQIIIVLRTKNGPVLCVVDIKQRLHIPYGRRLRNFTPHNSAKRRPNVALQTYREVLFYRYWCQPLHPV